MILVKTECRRFLRRHFRVGPDGLAMTASFGNVAEVNPEIFTPLNIRDISNNLRQVENLNGAR